VSSASIKLPASCARSLDAGSEYEDILHRDLLLAARCLGDEVRVDADLRRTILTQLLELYFNSQSPSALCEDIGKSFARLGSTAARTELLEALTKRLSATDGDIRAAAARALGRLGQVPAIPKVFAALLQRLSDTEGSVRWAAADALGRLGQAAATPEVLTALLQCLPDTKWWVREGAADALGQLGPAATPEVFATLLKLLSDTDGNVRAAAAGAVGNLSAYVCSQDRSQVVKLLLPLAGNKEDRENCNTGYIALRNLLAAEASD
jgi:HEAT repeat protein